MNHITYEQSKKLNELADFIEALPRDNFNQNSWLPERSNWVAEYTTHVAMGVSEEVDCGTACCVAGWGATIHYKDWPHITGAKMKNRGQQIFATVYGLTLEDAGEITKGNPNASCAKEKAAQIREILRENYEVVT